MGLSWRRSLAGWLAALLLLGGAARSRAAGPEDAPEAKARAHFERGNEHLKKGEYPEAYEELRKSLESKRTRSTMAAIASVLKQLGRYDEALSLYEQSLQDFANPSAAFRAKVGPEIQELEGLVGTISLSGDAPAGATLSVDNILRGKLPLSAPLRVSQGTHQIRVEKEGFDPISAKVEVVARKNAAVELVATSKKGRLQINERHGWPLEVEVDGKDVGQTPWEGLVAVGEHRVRLHGFITVEALLSCEVPGAKTGGGTEAAEAGAKMESPVETASVLLYDVTQVVLGADDRDASLKVDSAPVGAALWIDAKEVGKTPWEGRLALGDHAIEVRAAGFVTARQSVRLERRKQREVTVALEHEPDLSAAQRAKDLRNVSAGLSYGVGLLGIGLGAVTGGLALAKVGEIRQECGGATCPLDRQPDVDDARTLSTLSTVGFVVGGLGAAAGTVLLLTLGPKGPEPVGPTGKGAAARAGHVDWRVGVGAGGIGLGGRF